MKAAPQRVVPRGIRYEWTVELSDSPVMLDLRLNDLEETGWSVHTIVFDGQAFIVCAYRALIDHAPPAED